MKFFKAFLFVCIPFAVVAQSSYDKIVASKNGLLNFINKYYKNRGTFDYSNMSFNLAIKYAELGQKDSTFYYLNYALDNCPVASKECWDVYDPNIIGHYSFIKWHSSKEWKSFSAKLKQSYFSINNNIQNKELAYNILKVSGLDQSIRFVLRDFKDDKSLKSDAIKIDNDNKIFIQDIIKKYGYPTISLVGKDASFAAFLLCQHADEDIQFQKSILLMMAQYISNNDVDKANYAYLYDRIMVKEKGMQLYGTQFIKKGELFPIEDSINIDKRRREMGLNSLSEYLNSLPK